MDGKHFGNGDISRQPCDFLNRIFLKQKSKMTNDHGVFQFLRGGVGRKHLSGVLRAKTLILNSSGLVWTGPLRFIFGLIDRIPLHVKRSHKKASYSLAHLSLWHSPKQVQLLMAVYPGQQEQLQLPSVLVQSWLQHAVFSRHSSTSDGKEIRKRSSFSAIRSGNGPDLEHRSSEPQVSQLIQLRGLRPSIRYQPADNIAQIISQFRFSYRLEIPFSLKWSWFCCYCFLDPNNQKASFDETLSQC